MQARISELPPVGRVRLAIRVGFHFGPAIAVEGDVFGDSVNVAARMAALAKGEQVILSAADGRRAVAARCAPASGRSIR